MRTYSKHITEYMFKITVNKLNIYILLSSGDKHPLYKCSSDINYFESYLQSYGGLRGDFL